MACEAFYLGRESVNGPTDAKTLSAMIQRLLIGANRENASEDRKFLLHCGDVGLKLENVCRRDEGFESDDSESLRSTSVGSNEEKFGSIDLVSDVETSSANSSGSDFDDIVDSGNKSAVNSVKPRDHYSLEDIVFCHTDANVVVWIVRDRTTDQSLQAIVFQCKCEDNAKKLFQLYNETSRRFKLDRGRKGKWGIVSAMGGGVSAPSSPSLMTKQLSTTPAVTQLQARIANRWNLVERIDNDGVTHLEVSGGSGSDIASDTISNCSGIDSSPSSIVSLNTPDSAERKKEIDALILTEGKGSLRQRQPPFLLDHSEEQAHTPERPARKNKPAPQPPKLDEKKTILVPLKSGAPSKKPPYPKEPHVVRGQVVRVLVPTQNSPNVYSPPSTMSWWCLELAETRRNGLGTVAFWPPEIYTTRNHEIYRRRSRSKSPVHVSTRNKAPMTMVTPTSNSGISQKLKCFGEAVKSKLSTNNNGSTNIPPVFVRTTSDSPQPKSVIKKPQKIRDFSGNSDKKVTFSAFATVQMMD